ncbi:MAG: hypothetical protein WCX23_00160 [Candidatus Paceibacterota bacterium]|jgi:hypothetical protein
MTTEQQARSIMGKNFIGAEEISRIGSYFGIAEDFFLTVRISKIPYSQDFLKSIRRDYILILGIAEDRDRKKITINRLRERFGWDSQKSEPCFYNQDWYLKESFAKDTALKNGWYLIKKTVDRKTRKKTPVEIIKIIDKKESFPVAILTVFTFFAYYILREEILWQNDFIWCSDKDVNGDRIYTGRYFDPKKINKNGFNVHRYLSIRSCYGLAPVINNNKL